MKHNYSFFNELYVLPSPVNINHYDYRRVIVFSLVTCEEK